MMIPWMALCVNRVFEISLHACGVRIEKVQRVQREKVLRIDRPAAGGFLSLTAFQAEGCGGGFAANYKKGRG